MEAPAIERSLAQFELVAVADPEADDVALRHVGAGHVGLARKEVVEAARRVEARRHVLAEPALPGPRERQEQLEAHGRLRRLERAVEQIEADRLVFVEEVVAALAKRAVQVRSAAGQDGRAEAGRAQQLVGVPDDRVAELDAVEQAAVALREQRRGAVSGVDVQPDPVLAAERADRAQVVVEAGAGGACEGDQRERAAAGGRTALERILEPVGPDPLELVDLELEHRVLAEPEDRRGPPDRVVRGRRREQGEVGRGAGAPGLRSDAGARGEQRREVRERPAAREDAGGVGPKPTLSSIQRTTWRSMVAPAAPIS